MAGGIEYAKELPGCGTEIGHHCKHAGLLAGKMETAAF
jgi:hypothetical protein